MLQSKQSTAIMCRRTVWHVPCQFLAVGKKHVPTENHSQEPVPHRNTCRPVESSERGNNRPHPPTIRKKKHDQKTLHKKQSRHTKVIILRPAEMYWIVAKGQWTLDLPGDQFREKKQSNDPLAWKRVQSSLRGSLFTSMTHANSDQNHQTLISWLKRINSLSINYSPLTLPPEMQISKRRVLINVCPLLLACVVCALPPINIEVENGTLEDGFNLSMSHFPLPWLLEKE